MIAALALAFLQVPNAKPTRTTLITPIHTDTFNKGGKAPVRKLGGNPRTVSGTLVFDGADDGNRQVDPQIAVGGNFVVHATNLGIIIYDKKGNWIDGTPQTEFNGGIDPKFVFDIHNRTFAFEHWNPWDKEGLKPMNISVSETSDPTKAWNTYPVPTPQGVDGGAIGYSRKWIGCTYPGGPEETFVMKSADLRSGKPANVYHFFGSLGHPVFVQDRLDDMYFAYLTNQEIIITRVSEDADGAPYIAEVVRKPHFIANFGYPPQSPMKGVTQRTASGDRNPKNFVLQSGSLWFSQTVSVNNRAAIRWHQFKLDGTRVQSGLIADSDSSYIQTTIAVNKQNDVLVGFQETSPSMFISALAAIRQANDRPGTLSPFLKLAEGVAATEGGAWGDYSGSVVDGDNLLDLWTIQSVANAQGKGSTVIAKVQMRKR
jgi:hypothetical protein